MAEIRENGGEGGLSRGTAKEAPGVTADMDGTARRPLAIVGKVLLSLLLLATALSIVGPDQVLGQLRRLPISYLGPAALGGLLGLAIQWLKWQRLLSHVRHGSTPGEGLRSLLPGFRPAFFSPGRLGELGRGFFLTGSRTAMTAAAIADRACSVYVTLAAGALGLTFFRPSPAPLPSALSRLPASLPYAGCAGCPSRTAGDSLRLGSGLDRSFGRRDPSCAVSRGGSGRGPCCGRRSSTSSFSASFSSSWVRSRHHPVNSGCHPHRLQPEGADPGWRV